MWIEVKLSNLHRVSAYFFFSVLRSQLKNQKQFFRNRVIDNLNASYLLFDFATRSTEKQSINWRFYCLSVQLVYTSGRFQTCTYLHAQRRSIIDTRPCVYAFDCLLLKFPRRWPLFFFANNFISPDRTGIQFSQEYTFDGFSFISWRGARGTRWYVRIENVFWKVHWQERIKGDVEARGETLPEENQ